MIQYILYYSLNVFELQKVNTELRKFQQVVEVLEARKSELENSF